MGVFFSRGWLHFDTYNNNSNDNSHSKIKWGILENSIHLYVVRAFICFLNKETLLKLRICTHSVKVRRLCCFSVSELMLKSSVFSTFSILLSWWDDDIGRWANKSLVSNKLCVFALKAYFGKKRLFLWSTRVLQNVKNNMKGVTKKCWFNLI